MLLPGLMFCVAVPQSAAELAEDEETQHEGQRRRSEDAAAPLAHRGEQEGKRVSELQRLKTTTTRRFNLTASAALGQQANSPVQPSAPQRRPVRRR